MMAETTDQDELRDLRRAERGQRFDRFVKGEPIPNFYAEELVPMVERHFAMWLEAVIAKKAPPETLQVLKQLMADIDERITLGEKAAQRIIRRRYKIPADVRV